MGTGGSRSHTRASPVLTPHSPHPVLDLLDRVTRRLSLSYPLDFPEESLLFQLCSHVATFAEEQLGASPHSLETYALIRKASKADRFDRFMNGNGWNGDLRTLRDAIHTDSARGQAQWESAAADAVEQWRRQHLDGEVNVAVLVAQHQCQQQYQQLTAQHLDPSGSLKLELRRALVDHMCDPARLHVSELHAALRDAWEAVYDGVNVGVFQQLLGRMFAPDLSSSSQFRATMERIGRYTLHDAFMQEWEDYLTCNDQRTATRKAEGGVNHHRLLALMQQRSKAHLHSWLTQNGPGWRRRFRSQKRRVFDEMQAGIRGLLESTAADFFLQVQERVAKSARHFLDNAFWARRKVKGQPRQLCLLDSGVKHFLQEARDFDSEAAPSRLTASIKQLFDELKRWEARAWQAEQHIAGLGPGALGRELVVGFQRGAQYSDWVRRDVASPRVALLMAAAGAAPLNPHSKLSTGQVEHVGCRRLAKQWRQRQLQCGPSPSLPQRISALNRNLRRSKQLLAVDSDLSFGEGSSRTAAVYAVDLLFRAVAVALVCRGDGARLLACDPRDVEELILWLREQVWQSLDNSALAHDIRALHYCSPSELRLRLQAGEAFCCPLVLQLLATRLRLHLAIWTLENSVQGAKVQLLRHDQLAVTAQDTSLPEQSLHLAFLPQHCAGQPGPSEHIASCSSSELPYCVLALFTTHDRQVTYVEEAELREYQVDGGAEALTSTRDWRARDRAERNKRRRSLQVQGDFTPHPVITRIPEVRPPSPAKRNKQ